MKKTITLFLAFVLIFSLVVSISAEGTVTFTEHYETDGNGELKLMLEVPANNGITDLKIKVTGNPEILIKKVEAGTATRSGNNEISSESNTYSYAYKSLVPLDEGSVLEITFYSNTLNAEILRIGFEIISAFDAQGESVSCTVEDITCVNPAYGNQSLLEQGQAAYTEEPEETTFVFPSSVTEVSTLPPEEIAKDAAAVTEEGETLPKNGIGSDELENTADVGESADDGDVPANGAYTAVPKDVKKDEKAGGAGKVLAIVIPSACAVAVIAAVIVFICVKKAKNKKG